MKIVLVMFKDGERRDFPVSGSNCIVGRKSDCALRVPTADVSRRHCEIKVNKGEITVRDLGSANGTYVNGKRVAESAVKAGDELAVGPVKFYVQVDGKPADLKPRAAAPGDAAVGAGSGVMDLEEDDLFVLEDDDFVEDDALSALGSLHDDDDDDEPKGKQK
jgi:pSer/pThr/pTyr-binding forkhead associated (FHA) protein